MNAAILNLETLRGGEAEAKAAPVGTPLTQAKTWDEETFARQQIQTLVRRVFFSDAQTRVQQVVFSAVEAETDIQNICTQVAHTLAQETSGAVAVLGGDKTNVQRWEDDHVSERRSLMPLQRVATRVRGNLWLLPPADLTEGSTSSLHSYLGELRREFDYSVVAGPPAAESAAAIALGQFADGLILVLSAHRTRRPAARKVIEALAAAHARLLGTVLMDRTFPIPEPIYRRL